MGESSRPSGGNIWHNLNLSNSAVEAEGERGSHRAQQAVRIDRNDPVGQAMDIANVLMGHVIGGLAFLAISCLVNAQRERPTCQGVLE